MSVRFKQVGKNWVPMVLILQLLGVFGAHRPLCRKKKSTLMTEPLVNSALAQFMYNKTGTRQYTQAIVSIFAEIHSTHPISASIFLLSPTLGLPPRFIDALFGVTGISG